MTAVYSGPIGQQIFDQMQADMDTIAQGKLFDGEDFALVPTEVEKCVQWRKDYHNDMKHCLDGFERFEDTFSFSKPYTSEDPHESFLGAPSAQALEAFKLF